MYVAAFSQATVAETYGRVQLRRPIVYLDGRWWAEDTLLQTATGFEPQLAHLGRLWAAQLDPPRRLVPTPPSQPPPQQAPNLRQTVGAKWGESTQECAGGQFRLRCLC